MTNFLDDGRLLSDPMSYQEKAEILAALENFRNTFLKKLFEKYTQLINSKLNLTLKDLKEFNILEDLPNPKLGKGYGVLDADSLIKIYLIDTESESVLRGRRTMRRRYQFFDCFVICIFLSARDFGRSIIRTEKFLDKIAEMFSKTEFNFEEFEDFSFRYYCLSNEPEKLKKSLDKEVATLFQNFKLNIGVEFNNNLCLLKVPYSVRECDKNLAFVEFALNLQKLIGVRK